MTLILGLVITATFSTYLTLNFAQQYGWYAKSNSAVNELNTMWFTESNYTDSKKIVLLKYNTLN